MLPCQRGVCISLNRVGQQDRKFRESFFDNIVVLGEILYCR